MAKLVLPPLGANSVTNRVEPLTIQLLGPIKVWRNGHPISEQEWTRKKLKQLLAVLLTEPGRVFTYDQLTEFLLAGNTPEKARGNLQSLMSRLRRTLEPECRRATDSTFVIRRGEGYCFNTESPYSLDTNELGSLVKQTGELIGFGRWVEALDRSQRAVDLYLGDFAVEYPYDEWTLAPRDLYRAQYLRALRQLAECQARVGDLQSAIRTCEHLLRDEPSDEVCHRQLMYYHYCAGDRANADRSYRRCVQALAEHLSAKPSPDTVQLHGQIAHHTAPKLRKWLPNNLPHRVSRFIGREGEIVEVDRLLGRNRLITLIGVGGVGKTRLALAVASELLEAFRDGVWFADLGAVSRGEGLTAAVASALNVKPESGQGSLDAVRSHLRQKDALLVLDNCEHLVDACAHLVNTILQESPALRVLATSRELLRVEGEVAWPVPPLELPADDRLFEELASCDAVTLFVDRAQAVRPDFQLTPRNAFSVSEICGKLEGLPLGIELAAASLSSATLSDVLAVLDDQSGKLIQRDRTAPPRHRSLHASLDWSHSLLTGRERAVLRRLSCFAGSFTAEAAAVICSDEDITEDDVRVIVPALVGKSLLGFNEAVGGGRFQLLETVRHYLAEKLDEAEESKAYRSRHGLFYTRVVDRAEMRGPAQRQWFDRLTLELGNLRASLSWFDASGKVDAGLCLATALGEFWERTANLDEGVDWLQRFLNASEDSASRHVADGLSLLARLRIKLGQDEQAKPIAEKSIAISQALEDENCLSTALKALAHAESSLGNIETAKEIYKEVLSLDRSIDRHSGVAACLTNLGWEYIRTCDYEEAQTVLREALDLTTRHGFKQIEGGVWGLLGRVSEQLGESGSATEHYKEAIRVAQEIGAKQDESWYWVELGTQGLGSDDSPRGDPDECRTCLEQAISVAQVSGDTTAVFTALANQAMLLASLGNHTSARDSLKRAYSLGCQPECRFGPERLVPLVAENLAAEGELRRAMQLLAAAEAQDPRFAEHSSHHYMNPERISAPIRDALGAQTADEAVAEGRKMALEDLLRQILGPPSESG
jgi:predicted ATPase/DNA-binding SARP family transcriptional activator